MQSEYFNASVISCVCEDPDEPEGLGESVEDFGEPPPHAANPIPRPTSAVSNAAHRRTRCPFLDLRLDFCSVSFTRI
jgi:hypothetical protein